MSHTKVKIPPIKIQGIKTKLVPLIKSCAVVNKDTIWIEPFMGSGVVGLNVADHNAIFADQNPYIINFYNQLRIGGIDSIDVRGHLEKNGALLSKDGADFYYFVRDRFNKQHCPLDFLFLNRSCFNGMVRFNKNGGFNVPFGHKPDRFAKAYVTKIVNQVKHFEQKIKSSNWTFLCQPFEETISLACDKSFIYCDPPYIGRHVDYYDSWDEDKENRLCMQLTAKGVKYMLSTWESNQFRENPYVNTVWSHCQKTVKEHFYFVGAKEANRNFVTEALLTNYKVAGTSDARQTHFYIEQLKLDYA